MKVHPWPRFLYFKLALGFPCDKFNAFQKGYENSDVRKNIPKLCG